MTVQLNFDSANQQRLLRMIEWLKEIGLVKSYKVSGKPEINESGSEWLGFLAHKDKSGALSQMPLKELEKIVAQARERIAPYHMINPQEEIDAIVAAIAALLYDNTTLSAGQAAALAGMSKADFIRQLGKFQVSSFGETVEEISAL